MKKIFFVICSGALFLSACKEVPPVINFGVSTAVDTTYVGAVPTSVDPHNVLAEEFTGEGCSNCPAGHAFMLQAETANPGRVVAVSLFQQDGSPLTTPPNGAAYNFTSDTALAIGNSAIYNNVSQLPGAGIDRVPYGGSTQVGDAQWAAAITARLSVVDSFNLAVSSTYGTDSVATITIQITYTQQVSAPQNLSVYIVEDSITDFQDEPLGKVDSTYLYNDVFRCMLTSVPFGDPILDTIATKVPGRFFQRVFHVKLPARIPAIVPAHCRVIAFVNPPAGAASYQVQQVESAKLVGP